MKNKLKTLAQRLISYFIFCVMICLVCLLCEFLYHKIADWWFWFPAKSGMAVLEWLQVHPPMMVLAICVVFTLIATALSYIFGDDK